MNAMLQDNETFAVGKATLLICIPILIKNVTACAGENGLASRENIAERLNFVM